MQNENRWNNITKHLTIYLTRKNELYKYNISLLRFLCGANVTLLLTL